MKKVMKDTIGWIFYIAFLAGLIWGIPKGMSYLLKTPYPMAAITSGSMWPELKKGDLVFIQGAMSKDQIKVNDIVVYKNPLGFTIHRVVKKNETTIVTKGDANNITDPPVRYEDIIGKAISFSGNKPFKVPMLGNLSILINKTKLNAR